MRAQCRSRVGTAGRRCATHNVRVFHMLLTTHRSSARALQVSCCNLGLRDSLGLEAGCACLALEGGVPPVLDCIVCAPWQELGDCGPLVAVRLMCLGNNTWVRCCQDAAYMAICMSAGHCRRDCRKHGTLSEDELRTLAHSQLCVGSTQCLTLMITASSHSEKAPFFTAGLRWFHHLQTVRAHNSNSPESR